MTRIYSYVSNQAFTVSDLRIMHAKIDDVSLTRVFQSKNVI